MSQNYLVNRNSDGAVGVYLMPEHGALLAAIWNDVYSEDAPPTIRRTPHQEEEDLFDNLEKEMSNDSAFTAAQNILSEETIIWEQFAAAVASTAYSAQPVFLVLTDKESDTNVIGSFLRWVSYMYNELSMKIREKREFTIGESQSSDVFFGDLYGDEPEAPDYTVDANTQLMPAIIPLACSFLNVLIAELCQFWVEEA